MASLDRNIKAFAEQVQEAFDADVKYRMSAGGRREASGASMEVVLKRAKS